MRSRFTSPAAVVVVLLCLGLVFTSCSRWRRGATAGPVSKSQGLEGQRWQLSELKNKAVKASPDTQRPFVVLRARKKEASGFNGCNNFSGSYELKGSLLVFRSMSSTKMACHGPEGMTEIAFMDALRKTRTFEIAGNTLTLSDERAPLARFTTPEKRKK